MKTRAAVLDRMGASLPYAGSKPLRIATLDLAPPGRDEVLVRIAAAGLCHSDLSVINGNRPRPMPMALGHEAAGVVEALGEDVTDLQTGDHVVMVFMPSCGHCILCAEGRPALCEPGAAANGAGTLLSGRRRLSCDGAEINHHLGVSAFADYAVVSRRSLVRVDPDLPLDEAALFGCAVLTGVGAVVNTARLQPGQTAAVIGLGGVGLASVLGAVASGAVQVVAVDLSDDKLALARQLGATHAVNARDPDAAGTDTRGDTRRCGRCLRDGRSRAGDGAGLCRDTPRRHHRDRRAASARRSPAAAAGADGRRGTDREGQLHRRLRAGAGHPALHRALSGRQAAGGPADERPPAAGRDQRGLRPPARGPGGAAGHRVPRLKMHMVPGAHRNRFHWKAP